MIIQKSSRNKVAYLLLFSMFILIWAIRMEEASADPEKQSESKGPAAGQEWTNSLGLKFVPAGTDGVLFCVYDVRVKDFEPFIKETSRDMSVFGDPIARLSWDRPGFSQTADCPVVGVSWDDAEAFCQWLTKREQTMGILGPNQSYRLPKDAEWSKAVGLNESSEGSPEDKDGKFDGSYPWGTKWPPPPGAGNYAETLTHDGYAFTSPVGTFNPNKYGLYDMGGNVTQWCQDEYTKGSGEYVIRGASYENDDSTGYGLLSSKRFGVSPNARFFNNGFRLVVCINNAPEDHLPSGPIAEDQSQKGTQPIDAAGYCNRAFLEQQKRDFDGAIADYTKAIELKPDPGYYAGRAMAKQLKGDLDGTLADYSKAIDLNPNSGTYYSGRALARQFNGDLEGAIADYGQCIKFETTPLCLAGYYVQRGTVKQQDGDLHGAIADFTQALTLNPPNASVYNDRARAKEQLADFDGAIEDLNRAIQLDPAPGYYEARGNVKKEKSDWEGAIADLTKVIEIRPFPYDYSYRAEAEVGKGDLDGAIADYTKAIELQPNHSNADYRRLTKVKERKGDLNGAIADLTKLLELEPYLLDDSYRKLADQKQGQGDSNGTIAEMTKVIELKPDCAYAYLLRSSARTAKGDLNGAKADFEKASQLEEANSADGYLKRGNEAAKNGDHDAAIAAYTKAIELNPNSGAAYFFRSTERRSTHDLEGAKADSMKSQELAAKELTEKGQ